MINLLGHQFYMCIFGDKIEKSERGRNSLDGSESESTFANTLKDVVGRGHNVIFWLIKGVRDKRSSYMLLIKPIHLYS